MLEVFIKGVVSSLFSEIAKELKDFKFYLYGKRNEKFYKLLKNIHLKPFVQQSKIPQILNNSDLLLLPYSKSTYFTRFKKFR